MAAGELIMLCFHARTNAHVLHLQTKSYAAHKALQDFYEGIVPLVDSFAEAHQGEHGLISSYPARYTFHQDALELLESLYEWIEEHRFECCDEDDTYIQNIIDEMMALIQSTRYKLRFLK